MGFPADVKAAFAVRLVVVGTRNSDEVNRALE